MKLMRFEPFTKQLISHKHKTHRKKKKRKKKKNEVDPNQNK